MPKRGSRFRRPPSECFSFVGWEAVAKTVQSGKRDISPGSMGVVTISFRRNPAKYTYVCRRRLMRYDEWQAWMRGNWGEKWNDLYLGNL